LGNKTNKISFRPELAITAEAVASKSSAESTPTKISLPDYHFLEIFFITILIYFGGKSGSHKLKISLAKERKLWNVLLLFIFTDSAGTGMILRFIGDFEWFKTMDFIFLPGMFHF